LNVNQNRVSGIYLGHWDSLSSHVRLKTVAGVSIRNLHSFATILSIVPRNARAVVPEVKGVKGVRRIFFQWLGTAKTMWAIAHRLLRLVWKILNQGVRYIERGDALILASCNGGLPP
jgi:hypothetical protein